MYINRQPLDHKPAYLFPLVFIHVCLDLSALVANCGLLSSGGSRAAHALHSRGGDLCLPEDCLQTDGDADWVLLGGGRPQLQEETHKHLTTVTNGYNDYLPPRQTPFLIT